MMLLLWLAAALTWLTGCLGPEDEDPRAAHWRALYHEVEQCADLRGDAASVTWRVLGPSVVTYPLTIQYVAFTEPEKRRITVRAADADHDWVMRHEALHDVLWWNDYYGRTDAELHPRVLPNGRGGFGVCTSGTMAADVDTLGGR